MENSTEVEGIVEGIVVGIYVSISLDVAPENVPIRTKMATIINLETILLNDNYKLFLILIFKSTRMFVKLKLGVFLK